MFARRFKISYFFKRQLQCIRGRARAHSSALKSFIFREFMSLIVHIVHSFFFNSSSNLFDHCILDVFLCALFIVDVLYVLSLFVCPRFPVSGPLQTELFYVTFASIIDNGGQAPLFLQEPLSRLVFSNDSGSQVSCSAHGNPTPHVSWVTKDGSPVTSVPGLR